MSGKNELICDEETFVTPGIVPHLLPYLSFSYLKTSQYRFFYKIHFLKRNFFIFSKIKIKTIIKTKKVDQLFFLLARMLRSNPGWIQTRDLSNLGSCFDHRRVRPRVQETTVMQDLQLQVDPIPISMQC